MVDIVPLSQPATFWVTINARRTGAHVRRMIVWAKCPCSVAGAAFSISLTCPRDAWRHADHTFKCPIESCFGCIAQARCQLSDVSILLSQDRQRGVHPPACHITHDRFAEHLREAIRK